MRAHRCCTGLLLAALSLPAVLRAAQETVPSLPASPISVLGLVQVVFALLLVLGAIGLFAWLLRRVGAGHGGASGLLKVVGGVMVGPRERLVVVEVGDTWLLLGVAASHVTLVHSMPRPADVPTPSPSPIGTFRQRLTQALSKKQER